MVLCNEGVRIHENRGMLDKTKNSALYEQEFFKRIEMFLYLHFCCIVTTPNIPKEAYNEKIGRL